MSEYNNSSILWEIVLNANYKCVSAASSNEKSDCKICSESLHGQYVITLPCKHSFHRNCILTYIAGFHNYKCPDTDCGMYKLEKSYKYDD